MWTHRLTSSGTLWERILRLMAPKKSDQQPQKSGPAVRNSALTLAESGNLLMMAPRAVDGGNWMKAAQALVDTGMLAVRAAEARNAEQLFDAGGTIYAACKNCHQKYWADAPRRF